MGVKSADVSSPPILPAKVEPPYDPGVRCPNPNCACLTRRKTCPICDTKVQQPSWRLPDNSVFHETAEKILALRAGGMTNQEIGDYLGLKPQSLRTYLYRSHRNGRLDYNSAKETIEYGLVPKALRNLDDGLDDNHRNEKTGLKVKHLIALKIAEGVSFKEFGPDLTTGQPLSQTAISIKIEQPTNPAPIRQGTIGGYLEGESTDG